METEQMQKIYAAMLDNGFSSLELELDANHKLRMQLDRPQVIKETVPLEDADTDTELQKTLIEIRSDKVGSFDFADRELKIGDQIKKGETLGFIKGISFQDRIKCSFDGTITSIEIEPGTIVDYGRLLFLIDLD